MNLHGFLIPNEEGVEEELKYEKTVNCFYFYYQYATPESKELLKTKNSICNPFVKDYFNKLQKLLSNEEWCPYPDFDTMRTPIDNHPNYSTLSLQDKRNLITNLRNKYVQDFHDFFISMKMDHCTKNDLYNEEWTFCGFANDEMRKEYCKNPTEEDRNFCCIAECKSRKKTAEFNTKKESIISGIASAVVILVIGSYFSAKFINDIKIQDSMKKSIRNQEKEYN